MDVDLRAKVEIDAGLWLEAYRSYCTKGRRRRHCWPFNTDSKLNYDTVVKADDLVATALETRISFLERPRGPVSIAFNHFFFQLARHCQTIDLLAQIEPAIACAIWCPVRVLLEAIRDKQESTAIAVDGLHELGRHLGRWKEIAAIYLDEYRVRAAVVYLYQQLIDFVQSTTDHIHPRKYLKRFAKSICTTTSAKLSKKLERLREAGRALDLEVEAHSRREIHETRRIQDGLLHQFERVADEITGLRRMFPGCGDHGSPTAAFQQFFITLNHAPLMSKAVHDWLAQGATLVSDDATYRHTKGTCNWLFGDPTYLDWLDGGHREILWVQGKPGCGKSTLSSVLAERQGTGPESPAMICRFQASLGCWASNPSALAAALIARGLRDLESLQEHSEDQAQISIWKELFDLSRTYPGGPQTCPFTTLWRICRRTLRRLKPNRIFLVIDSLEMCYFGDGAPTRDVFLAELLRLAQSSVLQIAIFSQPRPEFAPFTKLCISIHESLVLDDILRFSADKFDSLCIAPRHKKSIMDQIASRAEGCFQWAKLYLDDLNQPRPDGEFLRRLHGCPPGLYAIYDRMVRDAAASMDEHWRSLRQTLFLLMIGAQTPFSLDDVCRIMLLTSFDPAKAISQIGSSLVSIDDKGSVVFIHSSVKPYLTERLPVHGDPDLVFVSSDAAHARLAKECLDCLLDPQYASTGRIGQMIHRYFYNTLNSTGSDASLPTPQRISYEYAWNYWAYHVTAVTDPDLELLKLCQMFLHVIQFAYWAEFSLSRPDGGFSKIRITIQNLRQWHANLPDNKKSVVRLDDYFIAVFESLSETYRESRAKDRVLPWLTLMHLGTYLRDLGMAEKALAVLEETVAGLADALGSSHPVTLGAMSDRAAIYLQQGKTREAHRDYTKIAHIQEDILKMTDSVDLYRTLLGRGVTELLMTQYAEAGLTLRKAAIGLLRLSGPDNPTYQSALVWQSYVLTELGDLAVASDILRTVLDNRKSRYGDQDLLAATVQHSIGEIQRKQGSPESIASLEEAFATRRSVFRLSEVWLMDNAISLLVAYRDFGQRDKALEKLADLDAHGHVDQHPSRNSQVTHLRGCLRYDMPSKRDEAIHLLQAFLIDTDRDMYNRSLMWLILDLATMLRARNRPGDIEQAASNFDGILVDRNGQSSSHEHDKMTALSADKEPDPPRLLRLAEEALTLVRNRKFDAVQTLFETENVRWFCSEYLWLSNGAPMADTAWMKPP